MPENQPTPPAVPEPTENGAAKVRAWADHPYGSWLNVTPWTPFSAGWDAATAHAEAALAAERDNRLAADEAMVTLHGALEKAETELAAERERAEKAEALVEALENGGVVKVLRAQMETWRYAIRDLEAERDAALAEVEGLRRGLERFAKLAPDDSTTGVTPFGEDCRHARQLLERPRPT
jgi:hypothetical protein